MRVEGCQLSLSKKDGWQPDIMLTFDLQGSGLLIPSKGETHLIKKTFDYYHYFCDGYNDVGWGCGYRTLQSISSCINRDQVPDIMTIQKCLCDIEDKSVSFLGSKDWIGCIEASLIIDVLFGISCKILHINSGRNIKNYTNHIYHHFKNNSCPLMMGGDKDCASKGIIGINIYKENISLLILDPHFQGTPKSVAFLYKNDWIKWCSVDDFLDSSFYNICLPQI